MAVAKHRRGNVDCNYFGFWKSQRQWHNIVAYRYADIQNSLWDPARAFLVNPFDQRLTAAIGQRANATCCRCENSTIIIGRRGNIIFNFFAMIATRHTVNIYG